MSSITKCLFPVAGYGTRFLPVTKSIPKEMLPILTKPLIQYGVEEAMSAGITDISIITNNDKKAIKDYFLATSDLINDFKVNQKNSPIDELNHIINCCNFNYALQDERLGLGHAIYSGRKLIGKNTFAVILPDDLCVNEGDSVLSQMVEIASNYPECCIVGIQEVPSNQVSKYGVIDGVSITDSNSIYRVNNMVEKPNEVDAPSNLAIIGRYILTPEIFNILEFSKPGVNGEIQITDALMTLAKKGKVIAYKFIGTRFDCGSITGYVEANKSFANKYRL